MQVSVFYSNFELIIIQVMVFQSSSELNLAFYKKALEIGSLSKVISSRNVIDWCIRGYNLDVKTAHSWGLISKIVGQANIESDVSKWLKEVTRNSPFAIKHGLEAMDNIKSSESNHEYLLQMLELVLKSDDAKEGIAAFKEKRNPNWK